MSVVLLVICALSSKSESLPEMSCYGGMTSCGQGYIVCYEGAVNESLDVQLIMYDLAEAALCTP